MRWLLKRWYVWLAMFLLLGLATSALLIYSSRGRINQANFERIHDGMTEAEVCAILGETGDSDQGGGLAARRSWCEGPNFIIVAFNYDKAYKKEIHVATAPEILKWYAKNGWQKIKRIAN